MSVKRYEKVSKVPELYEDRFVEVDTFQAYAEMARLTSSFLSQLLPGEHLRLSEQLLNQADLYELDRSLSLKIHFPAWPIWILNRQIARGVKVYEARRALAGCQLLSGDFHGAVARPLPPLPNTKSPLLRIQNIKNNLKYEMDTYLPPLAWRKLAKRVNL